VALFLIPVAIFAVSAAAGGKGGYDVYKANKTRKSAASNKKAAEARLEQAQAKTEQAVQQTHTDIGRLTVVRTSALSKLDEVVLWLQRGNVKPGEWGELPEADRFDPVQWKHASVDAKGVAASIAKAAVGAAGAKALATQLAARVGIASTGAAISGLSGAAARNATLALLGGGALSAGGGGMALGAAALGSLNVGFAVLGVGFTARKAAAAYDTATKDFAAKCDTETRNQKTIRKSLAAIRQRCDQLRRSINGVAHGVQHMLDHGDPNDREQWLAMVRMGKALSTLARYRVLDEAGNLAQGWKNPYQELGPIDLEATDEDYLVEEIFNA
jgi:hypothetical protein